jgi:protein-disulfide isomerase
LSRLADRRLRLAAVLCAAAVLAGALVAASVIGARDEGTAPAPAAAPAPEPEPSLFAGIEQQGAALGSPDAPVTLVEYADLQCPYCARWALDALPTLVDDYVRAGKLRIVFHGLAFLGPDSDKALRTAVAAGRTNHFWDIVHGLYANQGAENAGWVTDDLVTAIAGGIPGLNGEALLTARWDDSVEPDLKRFAAAAKAAGINGTPSFQLGPTGGRLERVEVESLGPEGIVPAIDAALTR